MALNRTRACGVSHAPQSGEHKGYKWEATLLRARIWADMDKDVLIFLFPVQTHDPAHRQSVIEDLIDVLAVHYAANDSVE
jgi:hypothetical protein